jgi:hypothetical protein
MQHPGSWMAEWQQGTAPGHDVIQDTDDEIEENCSTIDSK